MADMTRTTIRLEKSDKKWLDSQAEREHVPMAELVRRAIHIYRKKVSRRKVTHFRQLLELTAGIWEGKNAGEDVASLKRP